jgi:hypothetical protein
MSVGNRLILHDPQHLYVMVRKTITVVWLDADGPPPFGVPVAVSSSGPGGPLLVVLQVVPASRLWS